MRRFMRLCEYECLLHPAKTAFLQITYLVTPLSKEAEMLEIDATLITAVAALISATATLVWAFRRDTKSE
ncbi:hypothetical protein CD351_12870 [Erythrobacter sp. KY5]|nr:hypothetical protein CD351_12870 [Erythrobacter sp. KY5]